MSFVGQVKGIIAEKLQVAVEQVEDQSNFVRDMGVDSLETIELTLAFESTFDVEIPDYEAAEIDTVQRAIEYLKHKIRESF